ncbi:hypothetical protein CYMTET_9045, partial [Cymbomonas tetramitiformis]
GSELSKLSDELYIFNSITQLSRWYRFWNSISITLSLFRVLKLMDFHPDIGMITRTIRQASAALTPPPASRLPRRAASSAFLVVAAVPEWDFDQGAARGEVPGAGTDLINFMALSVVIVLIYTMMGHQQFGATSESFKDFGSSILTCFVMMLGETSWSEEIRNYEGVLDQFSAQIFFWSYMILVFLFLLSGPPFEKAVQCSLVPAPLGTVLLSLEAGQQRAALQATQPPLTALNGAKSRTRGAAPGLGSGCLPSSFRRPRAAATVIVSAMDTVKRATATRGEQANIIGDLGNLISYAIQTLRINTVRMVRHSTTVMKQGPKSADNEYSEDDIGRKISRWKKRTSVEAAPEPSPKAVQPEKEKESSRRRSLMVRLSNTLTVKPLQKQKPPKVLRMDNQLLSKEDLVNVVKEALIVDRLDNRKSKEQARSSTRSSSLKVGGAQVGGSDRWSVNGAYSPQHDTEIDMPPVEEDEIISSEAASITAAIIKLHGREEQEVQTVINNSLRYRIKQTLVDRHMQESKFRTFVKTRLKKMQEGELHKQSKNVSSLETQVTEAQDAVMMMGESMTMLEERTERVWEEVRPLSREVGQLRSDLASSMAWIKENLQNSVSLGPSSHPQQDRTRQDSPTSRTRPAAPAGAGGERSGSPIRLSPKASRHPSKHQSRAELSDRASKHVPMIPAHRLVPVDQPTRNGRQEREPPPNTAHQPNESKSGTRWFSDWMFSADKGNEGHERTDLRL